MPCEVKFEVGATTNFYRLVVDNETFCYTCNDEDGLKLMIANEILKTHKALNS